VSGLAGLLGLGLRSGGVVLGVDAVRTGLQHGEVHCVVVAADAAGRVEDKVIRLAEGRGVPLVSGPPAEQLGRAVGKPPVMVVGIAERGLAAGIVAAAPRYGFLEE